MWTKLSLVILAAMLVWSKSFALEVPSEAIVEVRAQVDGQFGAVVGGDPVFVAQGRRVKLIADNGDGGLKLLHTTEMLGGTVQSLERSDDLLIAGWRSSEGIGQLSVFSLADPEHPQWQYDLAYKGNEAGRPVDLLALDNTLYVMDWPGGSISPPPRLFPVDLAEPSVPTVFEPLEFSGEDPTLSHFDDNYVLVTETFVGLNVNVVDVSDPHAPEKAGFYGGDTYGGETGVLAGDDFMVLIGTVSTEIVSLADPRQPEQISDIPSWSQSGLLVDSQLLLPLEEGVIGSWDLSDPSRPIEVSMIDAATDFPQQAARGPATDQSVFFFPEGKALGIALRPTSDPIATESLTMPPAYSVEKVEATPSGVIAIDSIGMLRLYSSVLDAIPLDPSEFELRPHSQIVIGSDGLGLLLGEDVKVLEFQGTTQPRLLGRLSTDGLPVLQDATIVGNQAWAVGDSSLVEIGLSEPSAPEVLQMVEVEEFDTAIDLAFSDGYLYVVGFHEGLFVYDVESVQSPQLVGQYSDCDGIRAIDVEEDIAVISCTRDANSKVLDVTAPADPVLLSSFASPSVVEGEDSTMGSGTALLQGQHVWLGLSDHVDLVDLGDPRSPYLIARFNVPGGGRDLAAAPNGAWVAASEGGVAHLATPAPLTPGQTATWYDPERSGEGWIVEMLEEDRALGYWFTYDADGNQRWLVGTGEVLGSSIVLEMDDVRGGRFGPAFNPDEVVATPAGQVRMMWTGCDRGWFQFVPEEGSDLTVGLRRLTRTLGLEDCSEAPAVEPGRARQSGSWYDSSQAGQGFSLQWLDTGRAVVNWFTFDSEGNPYWMVGVGQPDGERIVFEDLIATRGGRFGEAFDPADVEQFHWGELSLKLDCSSGSAEYSSVLPEFGSGTFDLERLTVPDGLNCN